MTAFDKPIISPASVQETVMSHELVKTVFGIEISDLSHSDAIGRLIHALDSKKHTKLAFCNAHTANTAWNNVGYRKLLRQFTVFADGVGIDIAAKWLHGAPFSANLNGTDFVPALLKASIKSRKIAMIGSKPGVAERAAQELAASIPQHHFMPILHGFSSEPDVTEFLGRLKANPVDILLVAMGNPKQEEWIAANVTSDHATLVMGVGALFDFLAGEVTRAPQWMQDMRIEWLYRLNQEPERLFWRYVLGNPLFLLRVLQSKLGLRTL